MGKRQPVVGETPTNEAHATNEVAAVTREPGDDTPAERKYAPDPFVVVGDYAAGVRLLESRRFRRSEIEFLEGKPS